ncbi:MAG: alpha/beta hydrolase [Chloroflexi bacterium]|nr:MAG: alpha/beta hydrolase [Chloroflexota bacterium]
MRLVFVHAAGSSGDEWVQQRLAFSGAYEVATPDLPGHGRSAEEPLRRIEDMAEWLERTQDIARAVLIGHSMGAAAALGVAARAISLRGLVLIGAALQPRVPEGFVERVALDPTVAVERLATNGFARGTRMAVVEKASAYLARTDPNVLAADFAATAAFDATAFVSRVRVPTLVVTGAEDRLTTVADAEALARGIRGAELAVIDGAGHMVMLERPREFDERLERFFRGLSG